VSGPTIYAYVEGNPLKYSDPLGLDAGRRRPGRQPVQHLLALLRVQAGGPPKALALGAGPTDPRLGPANSYQYDANGSRTSDNATSYTYDVRGRLVQAGGASYIVNSLGQRIAKQYGGQTAVYHYDQGGRPPALESRLVFCIDPILFL